MGTQSGNRPLAGTMIAPLNTPASMSALPPKADIRDAITAKYTAHRCCLRISSATVGTNGKKGTLMVVLTLRCPTIRAS